MYRETRDRTGEGLAGEAVDNPGRFKRRLVPSVYVGFALAFVAIGWAVYGSPALPAQTAAFLVLSLLLSALLVILTVDGLLKRWRRSGPQNRS